eukprot:Phypoly_transcript_19271.p1 GENE.Phypoly_transcript_19271~~Phypoly_transcript_19271.p1  ORF type:complete len:197 (+),score=26.15 Phypoly_transcript_19271:28-618(+)
MSAKKSSIYTRTGDAGTSSLFNGKRGAKDDDVFEALGNVDELNAHIGLAREHCKMAANGLDSYLEPILSILLDMGSSIATPLNNSSPEALERTKFDEAHIEHLEKAIDVLDAALPPLKNFILPSGGLSAAHLHVARTVCRRAERSIVPLLRDGAVPSGVGKYINRLSDFLFVCARYAAMKENHEEVAYKKGVGKLQ